MSLNRSENWPQKLRAYLSAQNDVPFAWSSNDCCSNACGWIRLATGIDLYAEFRGRYSDEPSAEAAILAITGTGGTVEDAADYLTLKYKMPEINPKLASRGDVVLFDGQLGPMLGIVNCNPVYSVFPGDAGLRSIRTTTARRAWRV